MYLARIKNKKVEVIEWREQLDDKEGYITIEIHGNVDSYIDKNYVDGEWQDVPKEPIPPEPSQEEILQEKLSKLSDKLDRQSAVLLQIGMSVVKPPDASEIPEVPPVPPAPTSPAGAPPVPDGMPDAETLKKLMGTP